MEALTYALFIYVQIKQSQFYPRFENNNAKYIFSDRDMLFKPAI